jgi:hypothetical protein
LGYWGALSFHCIVILITVFFAEKLLRKNGYSFKSDLAIPLSVVVIIFANPRMKEYDFIILLGGYSDFQTAMGKSEFQLGLKGGNRLITALNLFKKGC